MAIRGTYIDALQAVTTLEQAYEAMCTYTKEYLGTYLNPPFTTHDIHMLPIEYALRGVIDYSNALSIVHETDPLESDNIKEHIMHCAMVCKKELDAE